MENVTQLLATLLSCCLKKPAAQATGKAEPVTLAVQPGADPLDAQLETPPAPLAPTPPPPVPAPAPAPVPTAPAKLTYNDVCDWTKGLRTVLSTQEGRNCFESFMKNEKNEEHVENLHLYLEITAFKELKNEKDIERHARIMHSRYFVIADKKVLISKEIKEKVYKKLENGPWTTDMFDETRAEVFEYMKEISFEKFLKSAEYMEKKNRLFKFELF